MKRSQDCAPGLEYNWSKIGVNQRCQEKFLQEDEADKMPNVPHSFEKIFSQLRENLVYGIMIKIIENLK